MIKGIKARLDIHDILLRIYKSNTSLNNVFIQNIINKNKQEDINLINNVVLNSMRYQFHTKNIIETYVKKKLKDEERILLISSITQIVYLDFREYAVVNCTVEIAKKKNIYHGFINAVLKNVSKDKDSLTKTTIKYNNLPLWFQIQTKDLKKNEKKKFLNNFYREPNLHLVFKGKEEIEKFEEKLIKTSEYSGFVENRKKVQDIKSFNNGTWWVQDFSSFFPISTLKRLHKNWKYLDMCAAPGGKSFQILSKNIKITLNDKSKKRIRLIKENLARLNLKSKIINKDFIDLDINNKFDFIILDAPCSSIGTIRKNPEIFFKHKGPDFKILINLQEKMLEKASELLQENGTILYMVCSFLKNETEDQINKFLNKHTNFRLNEFKLLDEKNDYINLIKNKFMLTLPDKVLNNTIDGYFAAFLKKL
tara:strand:- start:4560 stop:5825 length:1266 start_codon:yes stop_codon:yes gene_type:complete